MSNIYRNPSCRFQPVLRAGSVNKGSWKLNLPSGLYILGFGWVYHWIVYWKGTYLFFGDKGNIVVHLLAISSLTWAESVRVGVYFRSTLDFNALHHEVSQYLWLLNMCLRGAIRLSNKFIYRLPLFYCAI